MGSGVGCQWAAHGNFTMQIRLPTTSIYENSRHLSGQPAAHRVAQWAAHGNFAVQIRLPTTSIFGYSGQLSGQPTIFKYGESGQLSGQPTELPTFK